MSRPKPLRRTQPISLILLLVVVVAAAAATSCKGRDAGEDKGKPQPATSARENEPEADTQPAQTAAPESANEAPAPADEAGAEPSPEGATESAEQDGAKADDTAQAAQEPPAEEAQPQSVLEDLRARAQGGDVAVFATPTEVVAVDAAGNLLGTLAEGAVVRCATDPATDVVWLVQEAPVADEFTEYSLSVIDLRAGSPQPAAVLSQAAAPVGLQHAAGTPVSEARSTAWVVLDLRDETPKLDVTIGTFDGEEVDATEAARERVVLGDDALLGELGRRARSAPALVSAPNGRVEHEAIDAANCEEPELCGAAQLLSGSELALVVVAHSCGDFCYPEFQLFDQATREFVDANDGKRRGATYEGMDGALTLHWSPQAKAWGHGGQLIGADGQARWTAQDAVPCGWLSAESYAVGLD